MLKMNVSVTSDTQRVIDEIKEQEGRLDAVGEYKMLHDWLRIAWNRCAHCTVCHRRGHLFKVHKTFIMGIWEYGRFVSSFLVVDWCHRHQSAK